MSSETGDPLYSADFDLLRGGDLGGVAIAEFLAWWTPANTSAGLPEGDISETDPLMIPPASVAPANPIGYAGYIYDPETGFYLARFRYYDPANGRWLSRDPIGYGDGANLFGYVGGMPTIQTDPMGLEGRLARPGLFNTYQPHGPKKLRLQNNKVYIDQTWTKSSLFGAPVTVHGVDSIEVPTLIPADILFGSDPDIVDALVDATAANHDLIAAAQEQLRQQAADLAINGVVSVALGGASKLAQTKDCIKLGKRGSRAFGASGSSDVGGVNAAVPGRGEASPYNCGNCAIATDAVLAGNPASALPRVDYGDGPMSLDTLLDRTGGRVVMNTSGVPFAKVDQALNNQGFADGAQFLVAGSDARGGVGHVFNARVENGRVRYYDGQTGTVGAPSTSGYEFFDIIQTRSGGN